jgi:NAD(P)-dependent dehydrogenase (short-subunit alcohol dehydrogenase family)
LAIKRQLSQFEFDNKTGVIITKLNAFLDRLNPMKLSNRVAIVTGGASSIGLAITRRLAADGASVVIADIQQVEESASKLVHEGHNAIGVQVDVSSEKDVQRLIDTSIERFHAIDILVNNAAISKSLKLMPFEQLTVEQWRRILDINTIGVFLCCRAVAPHMRSRKCGRIINLTSGTAFKGAPFILHYVASKGAVMAMTRSLARELGPDRITVNAVSPGFTLSQGTLENPEFVEAQRGINRASRAIPRDEFEEDIVGSVSFLASDDAAFVTGQILAVDGGSVYH